MLLSMFYIRLPYLSVLQLIAFSLPSFVLLLYTPLELHLLQGQKPKVRPHVGRYAKLVLIFLLVALNTAFLIQQISNHTRIPWLFSSVLDLAASLALLPLTYLEDQRKWRPSTETVAYILTSLILDTVKLLFLENGQPFALHLAMNIFLIGLKSAICILEDSSKKSLFIDRQQSGSPEEFNGIINRSLLWWLRGLFATASTRRIMPEDMHDLPEKMRSSTLGARLTKTWKRRTQSEGRLTFVWCLFKTFRSELVQILFPRLLNIGFTFAQPFLITAVLDHLVQPEDNKAGYSTIQLIAIAAFVYSGIAFTELHGTHSLFRFITMFRGATVSLIYEKCFWGQYSIDNAGAVSLMSNDVDEIAFSFEELNETWARFIELVIGVSLLARQMGWVSVVPIVVVVLSSVGSSIITKLIGERQAQWASLTQNRLTKTKTILSEIKGIKMMGLEVQVGNSLQEERLRELKQMKKFTWIMVWVNVVANIPSAVAPAATFSVFAIQAYIQGSDFLDTVQIFTSLALINLVAYPAARLLSAVPLVAASIGSFQRIQEFLVQPEPVDTEFTITPPLIPTLELNVSNEYSSEVDRLLDRPATDDYVNGLTIESQGVLEAKDLNISTPSGQLLIKNLTFTVPQGSTICITGPIGSGKSILLKALLGQIKPISGMVYTPTPLLGVSYCAQTPWIPQGSIKDVICNISPDVVGDEIDEEWYHSVIEACALSKDLNTFATGDATIVGSRGMALSGGQKQRVALARALYNRSSLFILDDVFSSLDSTTKDMVIRRLLGRNGLLRVKNPTVVIVSYEEQILRHADNIIFLPASHTDRAEQGSYDELCANGYLRPAMLEQNTHRHSESEQTATKEAPDLPELQEPSADEAQDLERKTGDWSVYAYYFRVIGCHQFSVFLFFAALNAIANSFSSIWLKWWGDIGGHQAALYIAIYFLLSLGTILGIGGYAWAIAVVIAPSTGLILHKRLLDIALRAPMSFFTKTETGAILNRFGQDMRMIEGQLSYGLLATITNSLAALTEVALITTGSYYMAIAIPFILIVFYYLQHYYLQVSRQLRLLELESRSPVYSHFLETLEGLETIKAFRWQKKMTSSHYGRLDRSQQPYYLMFCIERWLTLVLDLIVAGVATAVVALALSLRHSTNPGLLGVSMNAVLAFSQSIAQFMAGWTALETSLGAIARLRHLQMTVKPEPEPDPVYYPPEDWPATGRLDISSLNASYSSTSHALRDINLAIKPGQHIAICGRTGSGKSSFLGALLRILPEINGEIYLDSIDTSKVDLWNLRRRIISIPQDFVHIPGSVRLNLDPFQQCTEEEVVNTLQKVKLWDKIISTDDVDSDFDPLKFSVGERQLLSLARAILQYRGQRTRLILMDEATSSLDGETEELVHKLVSEEFAGCTVVSVAHRLETIRRADRVVVMEGGRIVEAVEPGELSHTVVIN